MTVSEQVVVVDDEEYAALHEELVEACEAHLLSLGITLWGRAYDVVQGNSRRDAAEWLASQITAVYGVWLDDEAADGD